MPIKLILYNYNFKIKYSEYPQMYHTVKGSLNTFLKVGDHREQFKDALQQAVLQSNLIIFEGYQLINFHIKKCLTNNIDLPTLDKAFLRLSLSLVAHCSQRKKPLGTTRNKDLKIHNNRLIETAKEFHALKPPNYIFANMNDISYIVQELANTMYICVKNHLKRNLVPRIKKYLKFIFPNKEITCAHIFGDTYHGDHSTVLEIRQLLHDKQYLKIYYKILRSFEDYNLNPDNERPIKLFNLLPTKSTFTPSYIIINNTALSVLLRQPLKLEPNDVEDKSIWWNKYFNITKKNYKFEERFSTDGQYVSILYSRGLPAKRKIKQVQAEIKSQRERELEAKKATAKSIIGLDPGRRNLFYATDNDGEVLKMTGKEYRNRSGMERRGKTMNRLNEQNEEIYLNMPSCKTSYPQKEYLVYIFKHIHQLIEHGMEKSFRKYKFSNFCGSKKVLDQTADLFKDYDLIGFGNWSNIGTVKRHTVGPVKKLKDLLKRRYNTVISIDEYKTSKTCSFCHGETTVIINKDGRRCNGIVRCCNNGVTRPRHARILSRDMNASKNILLLLECLIEVKDRPNAFQRGRYEPKARYASSNNAAL